MGADAPKRADGAAPGRPPITGQRCTNAWLRRQTGLLFGGWGGQGGISVLIRTVGRHTWRLNLWRFRGGVRPVDLEVNISLEGIAIGGGGISSWRKLPPISTDAEFWWLWDFLTTGESDGTA